MGEQESLFGTDVLNAEAVQTTHEEPTFKPAKAAKRRSSYQEPMFGIDVFNDYSGRVKGLTPYRLPVLSRGECEGRRYQRAAGQESCPFVNCRYHLVGEAMRIKDQDNAAEVQVKRWEGEIKHTCVLDVADLDEADDEVAAPLLGIDREKFPQRVAEASFAMRDGMRHEFYVEHLYADLVGSGSDMDSPAQATATGITDKEDDGGWNSDDNGMFSQELGLGDLI